MTTTTASKSVTTGQLAKIFPAAGAPGIDLTAAITDTGLTEQDLVKLVDKGFVTDTNGLFNLAPKAKRTAAKAAAAKPVNTSGIVRAKSTISKDGTQKCVTCGKVLPVTKFPTKSTKDGVVRGDTCRADLVAKRVPRGTAKPAPKAKAPTKAPTKAEQTLPGLKAQAKAAKVKGYTKMTAAQLRKALKPAAS